MKDFNEHPTLMAISRGILLVLGAICIFLGAPTLLENGATAHWGVWLAVALGATLVASAFLDSAAGVIVTIILLAT